MGMPDEGEQAKVRLRLRTLCLDLNVDAGTEEDAWETFDRLSYNYTLEGDSLHWLACCLYVSCRRSQVSTVSGLEEVEGNFVSLTRLLRITKLSLIEFFKKMLKWVDMASLPPKFRDKVNRLERNFCVSTVTFRKFLPIFKDIFHVKPSANSSSTSIADVIPKGVKGRRQKRTTVNVGEVFVFCWTAFVQVKGKFSSISDDLVNCFHLLLCCVDWIFANVLLSNYHHLLNPDFEGLPKNFVLRDFKAPNKAPCILCELCRKYLGIEIEAKEIKNYYWKSYIRKLFDNKLLVGNADNLMKVLDVENFDRNNKALNKAYEEYVLNSGDFDEREFIGENNPEITSPTHQAAINPSTTATSTTATAATTATCKSGEEDGVLISTFEERLRTLQQEAFSEHKPLHLHTPLTNRRYLCKKEAIFSPVSTATHSVCSLFSLLAGHKDKPSEELVKIFKSCSRNPATRISKQITELGEVFCRNYMQPKDNALDVANDSKTSENNNNNTKTGDNTAATKSAENTATTTKTGNVDTMDFSRPRLHLAVSLYYLLLQKIVQSETRNPSLSHKNNILETIFEQHELHRALFAVSLEVVLFSYNSHKVFPWVIDTLGIPAFSFYKVIEIVNRVERGLSRDVVKHLNRVEETILEWLVWRRESVLWQVLQKFGDVPSVAEVLLPSQFSNNNTSSNATTSSSNAATSNKSLLSSPTNSVLKVMVSLAGSPVNRPIHESFTSPIPTRRRLFDTPSTTATSSTTMTATTTTATTLIKPQARQQLVLTSAALKSATRVKVPPKQHILVSTQASKTTTTAFLIPSSQLKQATSTSASVLVFKTSPIATRQMRLTTATTTATTATVATTKPKATTTKPQQPPSKPLKRKLNDSTIETVPPKTATTTTDTTTASVALTTATTTTVATTDFTSLNKPKKSGSVPLFFRKVYTLASTRLRDLCERLCLDQACTSRIWTCLEHAIMHHTSLLQDRHLDQIIMCCVYVICKVTEQSKQFHDIMKCYRMQPQAESHVYRSVLLQTRKEEGGVKGSEANQNATSKITNQSAARDDRRLRREKEIELSQVRSGSRMQVSRPPTPTRLAGTSASFQFEERGDLIRFYNCVFIPLVKSFALKFASKEEKATEVVLSPLPAIRNQPISPRRISSNVYISPIPHKPTSPPTTPLSSPNHLSYSVNQSLPLDLQKLNSLIQGDSGKKKGIKDLRDLDEEVVATGARDSVFSKRLQEVVTNWKSINNAA